MKGNHAPPAIVESIRSAKLVIFLSRLFLFVLSTVLASWLVIPFIESSIRADISIGLLALVGKRTPSIDQQWL